IRLFPSTRTISITSGQPAEPGVCSRSMEQRYDGPACHRFRDDAENLRNGGQVLIDVRVGVSPSGIECLRREKAAVQHQLSEKRLRRKRFGGFKREVAERRNTADVN